MVRMILVFLLSAATEDDPGWRPLDASDSNLQTTSDFGDFSDELDDSEFAEPSDRVERSILSNPRTQRVDRSDTRFDQDRRHRAPRNDFDVNDETNDSLIIHPNDRFNDLQTIDDFSDDDFADDSSSEGSYWDGLLDGDLPNHGKVDLPERGKVLDWLNESIDNEDFASSRNQQAKPKSGLRRVETDPMPLPKRTKRIQTLPNAQERARNLDRNRDRNRQLDRRNSDRQNSDDYRFGRDGEIAQRQSSRQRRRDISIPPSFLDDSDLFDADQYDEPSDDISLVDSPKTASREINFPRRDEVTNGDRRPDREESTRHVVNSPQKDGESTDVSGNDADNTSNEDDKEASTKTPFRVRVESNWIWFVCAVVALIGSVVLNFYLRYIAWDIHNRYQEVVADLNELEARHNTSISLESASSDRFSSPSRRTAVRA